MLVMEGALDELRLAGGPPLISAAAAPRLAVSGARALMGGESRGPLHATAEPRSGERFLSPHTVHVSVVLGVSELDCPSAAPVARGRPSTFYGSCVRRYVETD